MKKYLLFFFVILFSCSKDGVNANLTNRIIGTWKTAITTVGGYKMQTVWKISDTGNNTVGIMIYRLEGTDLDNDDWEKTYPMITTARMSDKNTLVLEYNTAAAGAPFCGVKGTGKIAGDKLIMETYTECQGEDPDAATQEFTRQ